MASHPISVCPLSSPSLTLSISVFHALSLSLSFCPSSLSARVPYHLSSCVVQLDYILWSYLKQPLYGWIIYAVNGITLW